MGFVLRNNATRRALLEHELDRLLGKLKELGAEKVILFGSMARGAEVGVTSDLDLVVVLDTSNRFVERGPSLVKAMDPHVAIDLLVYTPTEWEALVSSANSFITQIVYEGMVLFER